MSTGSNLILNQSYPATYSATISNTDVVSGSTFKWWRDRRWLHIEGQILFSGVGAAGALTITLPTTAANNPVIDTSDLVGGTNTANATATVLGDGFWFDTGTAWKALWPKYVTTTTIGFWTATQAFSNDLAANGDSLCFRIRVPIVGWS